MGWSEIKTALRQPVSLVLLATFTVFFAGLSVFFLKGLETSNALTRGEHAFYEQELSRFITKPVHINDEQYRIVDGVVRDKRGERAATTTAATVFRTSHYALQAHLDPVFAIPGTNPTQLKRATDSLFSGLDSIANNYPPEQAEQIRTSLYPRTFLKTLPELIQARRTLSARWSPHNVQKYNEALEKVVDAYQEDISRIDTAISMHTGSSTDVYGFPFGHTSPAHLRGVLATLSAFGTQNQTERAKRFACFNGEYEQCSSLQESLRSLSSVSEPTHQTPHSNYDVTARLFEYTKIDNFTQQFPYPHTITLSTPACTFAERPTKFLLWYGPTRSGEKGLGYSHTEDIYFFYTKQTAESISPNPEAEFYRKMHEAGLHYKLQPLTNTYLCPDAGHDLGRISALRSIQKTLSEAPLFTEQDALSVPHLASLERRIIAAPADIKEAVIVEYLSRAGDLLATQGEKALAEKIGERRVRTLEKLLLLHRTNTARLEQLVRNVEHINAFVPHAFSHGGGVPLKSLYMTRGAYMTLLMPYNRTLVTSHPLSLLEQENSRESFLDRENATIASYRETMRYQYTDKEIRRMLQLDSEVFPLTSE